jgi:L-fuculose-phosphate aldolase
VNGPPEIPALRDALAAAARRLAAAGLTPGTAGNLSARAGEVIAVTPTGAVLDDLEPGHVTLVDLDGRVIGDGLEPTSEIELHLEVYRRHGAGAVVHSHPPNATALACVLEGELPCIHYAMLAFGGAVPIAPYRTFGTSELAELTASALDGHAAVLMASHGAVTHGPDLDTAVEHTFLLEWASALYVRAASIGVPRALDLPAQQDVARVIAERRYGATRRAAESIEPAS